MTSELASADEIHAYLVEGLNEAFRRTGVHGGELHIRRLLDLLLFAERRQAAWSEVVGEELSRREASTASGVLGAFREYLPADQGHAVASVYAEIARRHGWLRVDRALDAGEYSSMLATVGSWAAQDRVWEDVTSAFGPPSVLSGGSNPLYPKTLGYATRNLSDPMLFFHLWNGSEPASESSWPPAYEQPLLLAVRRGDAAFSTAFTFTPEGARRRPAPWKWEMFGEASNRSNCDVCGREPPGERLHVVGEHMGTFERTNLFYGVDHEQVYAALQEFWRNEEHTLQAADINDVNRDAYALHEQRNDWTVLKWTWGWEWDLRRRAQLHVSRAYDCPGLLTFIYDDDFWGCELFHHGTVIDQFQQNTDNIGSFFGDLPCQGSPELLLAQFPALDLDIDHARGYLTHYSTDDPVYEDIDWEDEHDPRNTPVRAGDGAGRLDGGAYWSFQNFLGASPGPAWRRFTIEPQAPLRTDD